MSFLIQGVQSEGNQIYFTVAQTSGVLNLDQALLYQGTKGLELPKIPMGGRRKLVTVIEKSAIDTLLDYVTTKAWEQKSHEEKASLLAAVLSLQAKPKIEEKKQNTIEKRVGSLALRTLKVIN